MYQKKTYPEKDEFVVCTIRQASESAVFCDLDEYESKSGMVHSSEIPRKQVRGVKVYLKTGSKIVCLVMDVDQARNQINLSIRRVGAGQTRTKLAQWNEEKKAHDIFEVFAKQSGITTKKVYDEIGNRILEKHGALFPTFTEVSISGEKSLLDLGVDKNLAAHLTELIQRRIQPQKAEIKGILTLSSNASDGLDVVRNALLAIRELASKKKAELEIKYLGAPKYKFRLTADNFKIAEAVLTQAEELAEKAVGSQGMFELRRD